MTACDKKVTVTFDATGGVVNTITAQYKTNQNYTLPTPIREGYNFISWSYNDQVIENIGVWSIDKNVTLKAKWEAKNYQITFDSNEGVLDVVEPLSVTFDKEVTLPTPTRKGYIFKGWAYGNKKVLDGPWKVDGENIELVAQWEIIKYTVTFDLDGGYFSGEYVNTKFATVSYGKEYDFKKYNPLKTEYEFSGWLLEDGTTLKSNGVWELERDVTLKAKWKKQDDLYYPSV